MRRRPPGQQAFTLIEVMVAATVLVVSFSAVIQAVLMGADMLESARQQQIAEQIIAGEVAFQRASPWVGIAGSSGIDEMLNSTFKITVNAAGTGASDDTVDALNDLAHFSLDNNPTLLALAKGYSVEAKSTNQRIWTSPKMIAITWTVTWTGRQGRIHRFSSQSCFGENGLHLSYRK